MTLTQFLTRLNYAVRGTDDDVPAIGTDEANYWVDTLNRKKDELFEDVLKQWRSTYKETPPTEPGTVATTATTTLTGTSTKFNDYRAGDKITVSGETVRTIATITSDTVLTVTVAFSNTASAKTFTRTTIIATGVQTYNLHRSFLAPSDICYTLDATTEHRTYFDIIHPQQREYNVQEVFLSDENPQILNFTDEIESTDAIVGDTLYLPGYYMPDDISSSDSTAILPIPDPNWAVMAVAAEIAFNDITYEDKAVDLNAKANALYTQMVKKNRRGTYGNPRVTPTRVSRIPGTRRIA